MPIYGHDDIIAKASAGQKRRIPFSKTCTGTTFVANNWYHLWSVNGSYAGGSLYSGTALAFQRTTDTTTGALYTGGNVSPSTKHPIYSMVMQSANAIAALWVMDMVGYYPLTQSASVQTFANTNGPDRYTGNGEGGLKVVLVAGALGGATASNITQLTYVDQDGNTGHTIPTSPSVAVTVSAASPTTTLGSRCLTVTSYNGLFLPLATGDAGVRSLTNIQFSAANTGLEALLLVRPLFKIPIPGTVYAVAEKDFVCDLDSVPIIKDGACLTFFSLLTTTAGPNLTGEITFVYGA